MTPKYILLVEDNPDDEELTIRALRKNHVANDVVVAHDGAEALEILETHAGKGGDHNLPAVTLLDLKLPKIDGFEVLRRMRGDDRLSNLPVVILTASKEQEDLVNSYSLGANAYVRKPVAFSEFMDAAGMLGLFWLVVNEPPPPHITTGPHALTAP